MHTKLFIPGKNWTLSLAELTTYFNTKKIRSEVHFFSKEFFAIQLDQEFQGTAIADLGGTIKIGEEKITLLTATLKEAFYEKNKQAQKQIIEALSNSGLIDSMVASSDKVYFGVSVYCAEKTLRSLSGMMQRFVGSAIKKKLSSLGNKAHFMGFSRDRKLPQLSHVEVLKKKLVEKKAEILFCVANEKTWIGVTVGVHNPFEFQKRDIYKPVQRKIFAIPPRLARIMVNLSGCSPGKILIDPFCGVGTILQEALLEKAEVVGVDVNSWCTKAATQNLEWLQNEYGLEGAAFRVLQGDVGRLTEKMGVEMVDCIVSEPDLGPALRQVPTTPYAQKIIEKLEPLFYKFIQQAYLVLNTGGRLVVVTPYIETRSGQTVTMPIGTEAQRTGFKRVLPFSGQGFLGDLLIKELCESSSLVEINERHKIGREIHIFQKPSEEIY